jgi:hypothetical protein
VVTHIRESRRSESMYTLQGKSDTHDLYASRVSPHTPIVCFLWAVSVYGNLSRWLNRVRQIHCSKKMWSQLHLSARLSSPRDPPQFLSQHNHWSNALKLNIYWWIGYIGLLSSYHQHVISTFNTYSWEPTYRPLIDTGEGYNLGGAGLSHHTLWPF